MKKSEKELFHDILLFLLDESRTTIYRVKYEKLKVLIKRIHDTLSDE